MPEAPANEFWRDIKAIENVFKPDALWEVYKAKITEGDERYVVPISEAVFSKPTTSPAPRPTARRSASAPSMSTPCSDERRPRSLQVGRHTKSI